MTPKARQLFLELCLLRLRYSDDEIEQLQNADALADDFQLRSLLLALQNVEAHLPPAKRRESSARRGRSGRTMAYDIRDIKPAIAFFMERLSSRKILRTSEQLDNFVQSIGGKPSDGRPEELLTFIQQRLEQMPAKQAIQKMRGADKQLQSESYVDLAKALMRS